MSQSGNDFSGYPRILSTYKTAPAFSRIVTAYHASRYLREAMANYGKDIIEDIPYRHDWWCSSYPLATPASMEARETHAFETHHFETEPAHVNSYQGSIMHSYHDDSMDSSDSTRSYHTKYIEERNPHGEVVDYSSESNRYAKSSSEEDEMSESRNYGHAEETETNSNQNNPFAPHNSVERQPLEHQDSNADDSDDNISSRSSSEAVSDSSDEVDLNSNARLIFSGNLMEATQIQLQITSAFLDGRTAHKVITSSALDVLFSQLGISSHNKHSGYLTNLPCLSDLTGSEATFPDGESVTFTTIDVEEFKDASEALKTIIRDKGAVLTKLAPVLVATYDDLTSAPCESISLEQYTPAAKLETDLYLESRMKLEQNERDIEKLREQSAIAPSLCKLDQILKSQNQHGAAQELDELRLYMENQHKALEDGRKLLLRETSDLEVNIEKKYPGMKYELVAVICGSQGYVKKQIEGNYKWFDFTGSNLDEEGYPISFPDYESVRKHIQLSEWGIALYDRVEQSEDLMGSSGSSIAPSIARFCDADLLANLASDKVADRVSSDNLIDL